MVYDTDGQAENNMSGVYSNGSNNFTLSRSLILNVYDLLENEDPVNVDYQNVVAWVIFNDDSGGSHSVLYNRTGSTVHPDTAGPTKTNCGKFKHGADQDTHDGNLIKNNICWHAYNYGFALNTSEVTAENNLIVPGRKVHAFYWVEDADSYMQDFVATHNTIIQARLFAVGSDVSGSTYGTDPVGPFALNHNVIVDEFAYAGDEYGVSLDQYGTDAQIALLDTATTLGNNCYYNTATSGFKWGWGSASSGGHGPAEAGGVNTTSLATWQATISDADSLVEDADLDTSHRATSENCADKGWRLVSESEPEPTPTPTPPPVAGVSRAGLSRLLFGRD